MEPSSFKGKLSTNCKKHSFLWPLSCQLGLRDHAEDQTKFTNKNLVADIATHFKQNPELFEDDFYKNLHIPGLKSTPESVEGNVGNLEVISEVDRVNRSSRRSNVGASKAEGRKKTKRSSDKNMEDDLAEEEAKGSTATGVLKTLLLSKMPVAPPASHVHLGKAATKGRETTKGVEGKGKATIIDSSPASSRASSVSKNTVDLDEESSDIASTEANRVTEKLGSYTVMKNVQEPYVSINLVPVDKNANKLEESAYEVGLTMEKVKIYSRTEPGQNSRQFAVKYSEILPELVTMSSPTKERGGRFMRPGIAQPDKLMYLSPVESFQSTNPPPIVPRADFCDVRKLGDDVWVADIFQEIDSKSSITNPRKTRPTDDKQFAEKLSIDEDVVKYIQNDIMQLPTGSEAHKIFTSRAETARTVLVRFKRYEENLAKIPDVWGIEKEGNFRIPEDDPRFPGITFTEGDLHPIFHFKPANHGKNKRRFGKRTRERHPHTIGHWFKDPDGAMNDIYGTMKLSEFDVKLQQLDMAKDAELDKKKRERKRLFKVDKTEELSEGNKRSHRRGESSSKGKGKRVKATTPDSLASEESSSSEEDRCPHKKARYTKVLSSKVSKPKASRYVDLDSDDLDGDESIFYCSDEDI